MAFAGESIWIIGASSGIGAELAHELAGHGATLILSARREDALEELNAELGGDHHVYPLDVADNEAVQQTVLRVAEEVGRIDRVIFMAAVYRPSAIRDMQLDATRQMVEVNLLGAIYVTYALLPILEKQGSGQIALCGSVAGYTGFPDGQPYSATKAAIINFAESLHAEVGDAIDVKLINPGFVRTPMTDKNDFHMPMRIEPKDAATAIAKGLQSSAFEVHFPKRFTYMLKLLHALPYWLSLRISKHTISNR